MLAPLLNKIADLGLQLYYKETPTQVISCKICDIFRNNLFYGTPQVDASEQTGELLNYFWTSWDFCGSSGKGIFWSFNISLLWLSNIMLNLLIKSSFDISLLLKLKQAAISLKLWTVNKPCYNDSFCLHEDKNHWFKKKATFI